MNRRGLNCLIGCLALIGAFCQPACDRQGAGDHPSPSTAPATTQAGIAAAPAGQHSDEYLIKLAALRQLIEAQPFDADARVYAAYVVKDRPESAVPLADALSAAFAGRGPPVVAAAGADV